MSAIYRMHNGVPPGKAFPAGAAAGCKALFPIDHKRGVQ
jgi:hypothetical protein